MQPKVDWFRAQAAECDKLATAAKDQTVAAMLRDMASAWLHMAQIQNKLDAQIGSLRRDVAIEPRR